MEKSREKQTNLFYKFSFFAILPLLISLPAQATFIPITVEESDGVPSGKNVRKIKFPNGTLTDTTGTDGSVTYAAAGISTDSLDFIDFEDTLDLDANLTLNQTTNTWTQTFTGDTTIGLSYAANSLTSGTALALSSSSTAITSATLLSAALSGNPASSWTGDLARFEITGDDADIDGSALKVGVTSSSTAGSASTALNISSAGPSGAYVFRANDDGTYTDSTPFVIDHAGNVGVGTTSPSSPLTVAGVIESTSGGFKFPDGVTLAVAPPTIKYVVKPSDEAISSSGAQDDDNLKFYMNANEVWSFQIFAYLTWSSISPRFGLNGPSSPTNLMWYNNNALPSIQTTYTTTIDGINKVTLYGTVTNGSNAGYLVFQFGTQAGTNTVTCKRGSYLVAYKN